MSETIDICYQVPQADLSLNGVEQPFIILLNRDGFDLPLFAANIVPPKQNHLKLRFIRCDLAAFSHPESFRKFGGPGCEGVDAFLLIRNFSKKSRCKKTFTPIQILRRKAHVVSEMKRVEFAYRRPRFGTRRVFKVRNTAPRKARYNVQKAELQKEVVHFGFYVVHF